MAPAPSPTHDRPGARGGTAGEVREDRLVELIAGLIDCDDETARSALGEVRDTADPLDAVARAITGLRHRTLEPQDRFRVAGFLRARSAPLPRRPRPGTASVVLDAEPIHLVHHRSLRRWDRTDDADPSIDDEGEVERPGHEAVIDLRDGTARFRVD